jgi:cobalt/nickel transport system permease protein
MHISEGILSPPVLVAGAALAAGGVGIALRKLDDERIPRVAVLAAAFFVASFVHVPIGPTSAHLVLSGLAGVVLGWGAFPAILVALLLQALLFGFGGLTTLGVNLAVMAGPAVACHYLFIRGIRRGGPAAATACGFAAGALAIFLSAGLVCVALVTTGREFRQVAELVVLASAPLALVEGLVTGSIVAFLRKVKPELLGAQWSAAAAAVPQAAPAATLAAPADPVRVVAPVPAAAAERTYA